MFRWQIYEKSVYVEKLYAFKNRFLKGMIRQGLSDASPPVRGREMFKQRNPRYLTDNGDLQHLFKVYHFLFSS